LSKGSISHNNRKFVAKNVDEKRVKDNVVLCNVDIKKTYDDLLDGWKQRYRKVVEFIENLGLKDKLEQFLHPITHIRRGR